MRGIESMEQGLRSSADNMIASTSEDMNEPLEALEALESPTLDPLFWTNALVGLPSAWHGHVPFAHWLIQALRPRTIVELGTHNGVSYSAFCESVMRSHLDTRCYAIDTWKGDPQAGFYGEDVYRNLRRFHNSRYSGFSKLLRMTFAEALPHFADLSVDLLHVDGQHTYEAVSLDYQQWQPKLSSKAVVLFHDVNVRERDFGVWRLWEELCGKFPSFEFLHAYGLGVLLVGRNAPAAVAALCAISDPKKIQRVRERFSTLGRLHVIEWESLEALERLRTEAEIAQQNLHAAAVATETQLHQELAATRSGLAETQTIETQLRQELAATRSELAETFARNRAIAIRLRAMQADLTKTRREKADLEATLIATQRMVEGRDAFINALHDSRLTAPIRAVRRTLGVHRERLRLIGRAIYLSGGAERTVISHSLRRRLGFPPAEVAIEGPTQYELWTERFDVLSAADRSAIRRHIIEGDLPNLFVIGFFHTGSDEHAGAWLDHLKGQLFDRWQAVLCFDQGCSPDLVQQIRDRIEQDGRVTVVISPLKDVDLQILGKLDMRNRIVVTSGDVSMSERSLYHFAVAAADNPTARLIYADEDRLVGTKRFDPWFKPDFSPELLHHTPYLGKCVMLQNWAQDLPAPVERLIADQFAFTDGIARTLTLDEVVHVPTILYHASVQMLDNRIETKPPSLSGDDLPTVSIIIPTKDHLSLLQACLASIERTRYPFGKLEIIIVDNNTSEPDALRFLSAAELAGRVRLLRDRGPFNYSRLNNRAVGMATGEVLVFVNNDTEATTEDWLYKLVCYAMQTDVGAVGAKLLYPDRTIQHGGVIVGIQGVAGHAFVGLGENDGGYQNLNCQTREISAVTGACLAMRHALFRELGGFDEALSVAFNDILLCLQAMTAGYRNIILAEPIMIHHESKTRGLDDTPAKQAIFRHEAEYTRDNCISLFRNDPYYNPNLSLERAYEIAWPPRIRKPWRNFALATGSPVRILMLSITHEVGHGVAVVLHQQATDLARRGFEVFVGGPMGRNEVDYVSCHRVYMDDPRSAACFAIEHAMDCVVAHTPPFFSTLRWFGDWPRSMIYDYGEPNPELFDDPDRRRNEINEKRFCYHLADRVFAISRSVQTETGYPKTGVIRLGNSHLASWDDSTAARRETIRDALGLSGKAVVLNVCRFHQAERRYKGIEAYLDVSEELGLMRPDLWERVVFVLAGKATEEDVREMEVHGLRVFANPSDPDLVDLYVAADVYMNFSQWEGYNLGIGQALAFGLPVIASDIPAHREFPITVSSNSRENAHRLSLIADDLLSGNARATRSPTIYDWEEPVTQLASVISDLCKGARSNRSEIP